MEKILSVDLNFEIRSSAIQISSWKGQGVPVDNYYPLRTLQHRREESGGRPEPQRLTTIRSHSRQPASPRISLGSTAYSCLAS
jgi:hypothetical protein